MGRTRSHAAGGGLNLRPPDAAEAAQEAGLRYATDLEPGIRRVRRGKGFGYLGPDGRAIHDASTLQRIHSLAIPPAWEHVWISTHPRGHLQATGRDARGRKQHRYHPTWRDVRDEDKFERMAAFARALPRVRRKVARDIRLPGLPRDKVVATVVRLLETTLARVGNEEYAQQNGSFGLTTLRGRHVKVKGATVRLVFRGKSGRDVEAGVTDPRVARIVRRCEELPGQHLFQFVDESGERGLVSSDDVNQYLRDASGADFTAKDFRTWSATVLAAGALRNVAAFESETEAKRNVVAAIDDVARKLGHTRAVCRKAYVHPAVIETYLQGGLSDALAVTLPKRSSRLKTDEAAVLALLRRMVRRKKIGRRTA